MNYRKTPSTANFYSLLQHKIIIIATMVGLVQRVESLSQVVFQEKILKRVEVRILTLEEI
jgi:hypothetical protein